MAGSARAHEQAGGRRIVVPIWTAAESCSAGWMQRQNPTWGTAQYTPTSGKYVSALGYPMRSQATGTDMTSDDQSCDIPGGVRFVGVSRHSGSRGQVLAWANPPQDAIPRQTQDVRTWIGRRRNEPDGSPRRLS